MRPETTPGLWKRATQGLDRLSVDERLRDALDQPLIDLKHAFDFVDTKAMLSDPFVAVKLWALSQIENEMIAVPGFKAVEFTKGQGVVDAMIAPVHDTAEFNDVVFDTRVVRLIVDANDSTHADMNGIEIYGIHVGFPVVDFDEEMQTTDKLLTVSLSGIAATQRRPLVGDVSVFVVSNTKSGIHKAFQVDILQQDSNDITDIHNGPIKRDKDSVQLRTSHGLLIKITMLTGGILQEVVAELQSSARTITDYAKNSDVSKIERAAIQATLTGYASMPVHPEN